MTADTAQTAADSIRDRRAAEGTLGKPQCPTAECPGDIRYAAPGRRHLSNCRYPLTDAALARVVAAR